MNLRRLTPKHAAACRLCHRARAHVAIWEGPVRSGKTIGSIIAWLRWIKGEAPPGALLCMTGRDLRSLKRNVLNVIVALVGPANAQFSIASSEGRIFNHRIMLVGVSTSQAEDRIQGATLAGTYCDELTLYSRAFFDMLLSRHITYPDFRIFCTTNPHTPTHWVNTDYLAAAIVVVERDGSVIVTEAPTPEEQADRLARRIHRYRFVIDDNPAITPAGLRVLKASYGVGTLFYRRYIEGEWIAAEGAVYGILDLNPATSVHVCTEDRVPWTELTEWTVAIDWGAANPTHALLAGWHPGQKRLYSADELVQTDKTATTGQEVARLMAWIEQHAAEGRLPAGTGLADLNLIVDPSAKALRNQLHRDLGRYARTADNAVLPGIADTGLLLSAGRLVINRDRCRVLCKELGSYAWDSAAQKRGIEQPLKVDDHGADALRYLVRGTRRLWVDALPAADLAA